MRPGSFHARRQDWSIHKPITFLSSRVVPNTPPSFEKFRRKDSAVMMGASRSMPSSDQVPELRKAVYRFAVMDATADAVSCVAVAMTGVPCSERLTPGSSGPTTEPASISGAGRRDGSPSRSITLVFHARSRGSTSWLVVALVNSHTARPVSQ